MAKPKTKTLQFAMTIYPGHTDKRNALVQRIETTLMVTEFRVLAGSYTITIERTPLAKTTLVKNGVK